MARKAATKKPAEPQIEWAAQPSQGAMFKGTIGDITYRVTPDYTSGGEFTWVTEVRISDDKVRTLEEAKDLAEKDLS